MNELTSLTAHYFSLIEITGLHLMRAFFVPEAQGTMDFGESFGGFSLSGEVVGGLGN